MTIQSQQVTDGSDWVQIVVIVSRLTAFVAKMVWRQAQSSKAEGWAMAH